MTPAHCMALCLRHIASRIDTHDWLPSMVEVVLADGAVIVQMAGPAGPTRQVRNTRHMFSSELQTIVASELICERIDVMWLQVAQP